MTYKIFKTLQEYNDFTINGTHLTAGTLYLVKENKSLYFSTNNIDGEAEKYEYLDEIPEGYIKPEGNIVITENGEEIDISTYATASVNVAPNLTTQNITENGTYEPSGDYDGFSSVTVNVEAPEKDYIVEGVEYDPTETYTGTFNLNRYEIVKKVIIPYGYTKIENMCFLQNYNMTDVVIPDTVTEIGYKAFGACKSLDTISIPDSVTKVGYNLFDFSGYSGDNGPKHLIIGSGLTTVDPDPNYGYEFYLGQYIGQRLESIVVSPHNVTFDSRNNCNCFIETSTNTVFVGSSNSTIPNGITAIADNAFNRCYHLASIDIPDSVTTIGNSAFSNIWDLTTVTIGNGITSIGNSAFINEFSDAYKKLSSVTIKATTPPTLGSSVFYRKTKVTIYVPAESVEAYKTATNWSSYASRIQAIS